MMLLSPLTILWLLLLGAAVTVAVAHFRPRLVRETAVAVTVLAGLVWLLGPGRLPLSSDWLVAPVAGQPALWTWRVDDLGWLLAGVLLLLLTAVLLALDPPTDEDAGRLGPIFPLLLLAVAGLVTLWANSVAGLMVGWAALVVAWTLILILAPDSGTAAPLDRLTALRPRLAWLLSPLFFLWLAAALAPADTVEGLTGGQWPLAAQTAVLIAALLQMGVWPLQGWWPFSRRLPPSWAAPVYTVPVLAGASLLARLAAPGSLAMDYGLFLTVFGLLGFLWALRLAWSHLAAPRQMVAALALAQTHLVLLAGVWAGADAAVAEARVLLLAVGVLFLAAGRRRGILRFRPAQGSGWRGLDLGAVGPWLALAALAGLPLTAGFGSRSGLYQAWLQNGRFILALVAALLHVPLVAAGFLLLRGGSDTLDPVADKAAPDATSASTVSNLGRQAAHLLPALGLLSLSGLGQVGPIGWLLVLLPPLAGFVLPRFLTEVRQARAAFRQAFALNWSPDGVRDWVTNVVAGLGTAVREATLILEGEGGLLWWLALLLIFLLARFL